VLLGAWSRFDLVTSALLIGSGGVLGVVFTVPLRRAFIVEGTLPFPEGVATAEVLRLGHGLSALGEPSPEAGARPSAAPLALGVAFGALGKLLESGAALAAGALEAAGSAAGRVFYLGAGTSPALVAVGTIVGLDVGLLMLAGGLINWLGVVPWVASTAPGQTALETAWSTWSTETRYLGVGAMTVGGLSTLLGLRAPLAAALRATLHAGRSGGEAPPAGGKDLDLSLLAGLALGCTALLWLLFARLTGASAVAALLAALVTVFGFLFSAVAGYMAGLVGSSNNPVSGVTLATILLSSGLLVLLGVEATGVGRASGAAAALLVGSVVCTAAAIGGDNLQDLKAGHLLGASPAKQQLVQLVGVLAAALVLGPVLELLRQGYGFGPVSPEHPEALRAPQATLMASVAEGVFGGALPWGFVLGGGALALGVLGLNALLAGRGSPRRVPVLAVAVGIYLPLELSVPIALGGALSALLARRAGADAAGASRGTLLAAGPITGEALAGLALAGTAATLGSLAALRPFGEVRSELLGAGLLVGTLALVARVVRGAAER
jgi:putative OPT family oligopeptide transporter